MLGIGSKNILIVKKVKKTMQHVNRKQIKFSRK